MTNLPKTLPAGTVVFVPDGEPREIKQGDWFDSENGYRQFIASSGFVRQCYTRHTLTAPLHILDEGMVEAVRRTQWKTRNIFSSGRAEVACADLDNLHAAFAHVLPPQETGKNETKTCREKIDALLFEQRATDGMHYAQAAKVLADAIDALRAELKEGRNG